jgi:hypothetical protein
MQLTLIFGGQRLCLLTTAVNEFLSTHARPTFPRKVAARASMLARAAGVSTSNLSGRLASRLTPP